MAFSCGDVVDADAVLRQRRARARRSKARIRVATSSCATRWMALKVSVGLRPSGPTSLVSLSICCLMPATRISKNSSRFELKMVRNLTRSISGWVGSCASSRTRRLNSSQLSSRLMKFSGAENRDVCGGGGCDQAAERYSRLFRLLEGLFVFGLCIEVARDDYTRPMPIDGKAKPPFFSVSPPAAGGQHSTISSARKRNKVSRANLRSSRRFFAICCDGTDAIELRSELRFGHGQAKFLDPLESIAGVSRDPTRLVGRLRCPMSWNWMRRRVAQGPMIDVAFAGDVLAELPAGQSLCSKMKRTRGARPELAKSFWP